MGNRAPSACRASIHGIMVASWEGGPCNLMTMGHLAHNSNKEPRTKGKELLICPPLTPPGGSVSAFWDCPFTGPDLLVEHRSPARPQHPPRGLGSLRHHRPLRVGTPTVQHTRPDLRHLRPGRLPHKKQRRKNGVGGNGHHGTGQRAVPAAAGGLYLLCARGGSGGPGWP